MDSISYFKSRVRMSKDQKGVREWISLLCSDCTETSKPSWLSTLLPSEVQYRHSFSGSSWVLKLCRARRSSEASSAEYSLLRPMNRRLRAQPISLLRLLHLSIQNVNTHLKLTSETLLKLPTWCDICRNLSRASGWQCSLNDSNFSSSPLPVACLTCSGDAHL